MGNRKKRIKPARKKEIAIEIQSQFSFSERRVCRLLKINRTFKRYIRKIRLQDPEILAKLEKFAEQYRRFGYKRLHILLRREGFCLNHKRTYRLYKEAGLSLRKKKRKLPMEKRCKPLSVKNVNERWSLDFVSDMLKSGKRIRILTMIDEATRECINLEADTCLTGERVVMALNKSAFFRGLPEEILTDNGPEFTSLALSQWCYENQVKHLFIEPGKPIQNAYIESFNGKFREECLNAHWFKNLQETRMLLENWRWEYNHFRPHSSLGNLTPCEYAEQAKQTDKANYLRLAL